MNRKQRLGIFLIFGIFCLVFMTFAGIDHFFKVSENARIKINPILNYFILTMISMATPICLFIKKFKNIE